MNYSLIKIIESIGLTSCEFDDECNFCNEPKEGSYARMTGYDSSEIAYFICGKCALEKIRSGVKSCDDIDYKIEVYKETLEEKENVSSELIDEPNFP